MTVGTDPAQCSYTIQDLPVASESGTPYTYTVTETAHAAPAAVLYLASRAAVNGDALQPAGDPPTLANITLLQNGTTYADFENTYARQTGSLRLGVCASRPPRCSTSARPSGSFPAAAWRFYRSGTNARRSWSMTTARPAPSRWTRPAH